MIHPIVDYLLILVLLVVLVVGAGWMGRWLFGSEKKNESLVSTLQILVGMLFGFGLAYGNPELAAGYGWLGEMFLKMLKMLVVPLVIASVIVGISSLGDIRKLGRTGGATLIYYAVTTSMAVLLGIIVVNLLQPGAGVDVSGATMLDKVAAKSQTTGEAILSIILGFFSDNILWAASAEKPDMLPLIVFSLVFGAAVTTVGSRGEVVIRFFEGINDVIISIVHWVLHFVPYGVFGLIAGRLGGAGAEFWTDLAAIGLYAVTVIVGLLIHAVIVLPLILSIFARRSPLAYARGMAEALMTAFSTASSSATYPLTLECATENNNVSKKSALFVLPVGATVNMDGTALYESVAAIFIAQAYGIELSMTQQVLVFVTASLAAIGAAGIPEAGLFTMVIVLNAVGLPLEGASLILVIDWFLDRCRTTVNVWGDAVGAAVIDHIEGFDAPEQNSQTAPAAV